jgi:hypothetical protein
LKAVRGKRAAGLVSLVVIAGVVLGIVALTSHTSDRERVEHTIAHHPNVARGHGPVKAVNCSADGAQSWNCHVSYRDGGSARCPATKHGSQVNFACFVRNGAGS